MIDDLRTLNRTYLKPAELARIMGVPERTIYHDIEKGAIEVDRFVRAVRIPIDVACHYAGVEWQVPDQTEYLESKRVVVEGVYFVRCVEFIKIGIARDIKQRLGSMSLSVPFDLTLVGLIEVSSLNWKTSRRIEIKLHKKFSALRFKGEWFHATDRICEFINGRDIHRFASRENALGASAYDLPIHPKWSITGPPRRPVDSH